MISQFLNQNANIISNIILIIQYSMAGLMIVNLILLLIVFKIKRNIINSDLYNQYIDMSKKYTNKLIKISKTINKICILVLLFLFVITSEPLFNFISYYINKYKEVSALIFGAFLASGFGLLSSMMSKRYNRKKDIIKSSRLLCADLVYILDILEEFIQNEGIRLYKKIKYNENWREAYAELSNILTNEHYKIIAEMYETVDILNITLNDQDKVLPLLEDELKIINITNSQPPQHSLIISDVILDLEKLSENKRPKNINFRRFISELRTVIFCKKHLMEIESYILEKLKTVSNLTIKGLQVDLESRYKKLNDFQLKKVIFIAVSRLGKFKIKDNSIIAINDDENKSTGE